jgi:transposase
VLSKGRSGVDSIVASVVAVQDSLLEQIAACDRSIRQLAQKDAAARRLMTVPGVGPVVALAYVHSPSSARAGTLSSSGRIVNFKCYSGAWEGSERWQRSDVAA